MARWPFNTFSKGFKLASVFLAIFVLVVISKGFFATPKKVSRSSPEIMSPKITEIPANSLALQDSDHDELKDWEEAIYHTNPEKPDTDGDDTPDGQEIAEGRDPLKQGPNDTLNPRRNNSHQDNTDNLLQKISEGVNLTQIITHEILQKRGAEAFLTAQNVEQTSAEFLAYLSETQKKPIFSEKLIPDAELHIGNDSSTDAIKQYFNSVAHIYQTNFSSFTEDETEIVTDALQSGDTQRLDLLVAVVNAVTKSEHDIKKIAVPPPLVSIHKKELWFMHTTIEQISLLQKANINDPLYIMMLMRMRMDLKKDLHNFHWVEIPQFFKSKNVVFSTGDHALNLYPQI